MGDIDLESLLEKQADMLKSYEKATAEATKHFEDMVSKARSDMEKMMASASAQVAAAPPPLKPAAQWVTAKDNEELLILNKPAADFFAAIFDQIGGVATELTKLAQK